MTDGWATSRFSAFAELGEGGMAELRGLAGPLRQLERGEVIRHEGETSPILYLLCSGWTASSMIVAGGVRQIIKVHMPGDLLGLPSIALVRTADTLSTLTRATILTVEPAAIGKMFERSPHLGALLFLISQEERVMLMDRVASLGRTDAAARIAALLLQIHGRVLRNDPAAGATFDLPLTQSHLADLTGLTKVHVNRTIQKLRSDDILRWTRKSVTIVDGVELRRLAGLPARTLASSPSWVPAAN